MILLFINESGEHETGDYRENVSYAVGEPLGVFSYIPHTVFSDDSAWLSKESVRLLWESLHPNWIGTDKDELWKEKQHE